MYKKKKKLKRCDINEVTNKCVNPLVHDYQCFCFNFDFCLHTYKMLSINVNK